MLNSLRNLAAACTALIALPSCIADESKKSTNFPVEVGPAKFLRSDTEALAKSKATGKPVFAFFQEVPG